MPTFCLKCGTPAVDDKSLFCNKCGAQLIHPTPEYNENYPQIKEVPFLPATDSMNRSQKSEFQILKPKKPLKRKSLLIPTALIFIAFILVILVISQTGILNPVSSNESVIESQTNVVIPAHITTIPTLTRTNVAPTTQIASTTIATSTETPTPIPTTAATQTATTTFAPVIQQGTKNIIETLESDGRFTSLVTGIKAAGLNDTLSDPDSNFTLFAPTDDAFKNLPSGTMDSLLADPQGNLLQILLYHVVSGKVMSTDLTKLTSVDTLQGGTLPISVSGSTISVGGAKVIATDIKCSNGVIHVVDSVMLPQD
jgi:uncharacterized surface protein with fasciclin (FAS1) repeats